MAHYYGAICCVKTNGNYLHTAAMMSSYIYILEKSSPSVLTPAEDSADQSSVSGDANSSVTPMLRWSFGGAVRSHFRINLSWNHVWKKPKRRCFSSWELNTEINKILKTWMRQILYLSEIEVIVQQRKALSVALNRRCVKGAIFKNLNVNQNIRVKYFTFLCPTWFHVLYSVLIPSVRKCNEIYWENEMIELKSW